MLDEHAFSAKHPLRLSTTTKGLPRSFLQKKTITERAPRSFLQENPIITRSLTELEPVVSLDSPFLDEGEQVIVPETKQDMFVNKSKPQANSVDALEEENLEFPQGVVTPKEEESILRSFERPPSQTMVERPFVVEEDMGAAELVVQFLDENQRVLIDYDPNVTIYQVKEVIQPHINIPIELQEFRIRRGDRLEYLYSGTLLENNVVGGDMILLTVRRM